MRYRNILFLAVSILLCLFAGFIGSFFTSSAIPTWYAALEKPSFNPPNWLFGPVWTTLYIMMGISLYLVYAKYYSMRTKLGAGSKRRKNNTQAPMLSKATIRKDASVKYALSKDTRFIFAALSVFIVQLVLNTLWSIIFFGQKNISLAFFEIILLLVFIIATIIMFYKVSRPAAYLMVPYLCWVGFASVLNYSIWMLNLDA